MSTCKERFENLVRVLDLHIEASRKGELATINGFKKSVKFDLGTWVNVGSCGTAACAVGSYMIDPWFKKQGFVVADHTVECRVISHESYPVYKGYGGWSAVQSFFGIDYTIAQWLFTEQRYKQPTAYNVKRRVLSFMKRKGYL